MSESSGGESEQGEVIKKVRHKGMDRIRVPLMRSYIRILGFISGGPAFTSGLIEGAIVANEICYPDSKIGALAVKRAAGGQYLAFDFMRTKEFPKLIKIFAEDKGEDNPLLREGIIWSFMPDGIEERSRDHRSVAAGLNADFDTIMTLDKKSPEKLMEIGMLDRLTMEHAYEVVGENRHIDDLRSRGVAGSYVYQVSPKGNGLIYVRPDGGDTSPKHDPNPSLDQLLVPAFQY